MKSSFTYIVLFIVLCSLFGWTQNMILDARKGMRTEEKILMLSDRPEVTKIMSLGFDNVVADLLWIRAIQYFGGNFSTLDMQEKRDGMMNLLNNLVGLDPKFIGAYKFAGFVINESMKEPETAMNFLIGGAENNPEDWQLSFDAGFIGFYQLKQYEVAKDLFTRAVYGTVYNDVTIAESNGVLSTSSIDALLDGDPYSNSEFNAEDGMFVLTFGEKREVGRVVVEEQSGNDQSYRIQYLSRSVDSYIDKESPEISGIAMHSFDPAALTEKLKFDQFTTAAEDGTFSLSEITIYGARNPETPTYIERMIFEMDRVSGRFLIAWEQNQRYYLESIEKGDTVSAGITLTKLDDIYSAECIKLIETAVYKYIEDHNGELPSTDLHELVEEGYLQQVIEEEKLNNPQFESDVLRVLIPRGGSVWDILTGMDGTTKHLLLPGIGDEADPEKDWFLASSGDLKDDQETRIKTIQAYVDQYIEEIGRPPVSMEELLKESWATISDEVLTDPLGGEYYIDTQDGKVKLRNALF